MDSTHYFSIRDSKNNEVRIIPDDGSVDSAVDVLENIRAGFKIKYQSNSLLLKRRRN